MLIFLALAMVGAVVWWVARLAARADTARSSATQSKYVASGFSRTEETGRAPLVRLKPDTTYERIPL